MNYCVVRKHVTCTFGKFREWNGNWTEYFVHESDHDGLLMLHLKNHDNCLTVYSVRKQPAVKNDRHYFRNQLKKPPYNTFHKLKYQICLTDISLVISLQYQKLNMT